MEGVIIKPKVFFYKNCDSCRTDDYIVLPKETPLDEVIDICFKEKCYGFARGSNTQGKGKFYIRSPHKNTQYIKQRIKIKDNVSFFILEY